MDKSSSHGHLIAPVVIGVGNEFCSDDAVGLVLVRSLRHLSGVGGEEMLILEHDGEGTSLLEILSQHDPVVIIDAVQSGKAPGTIQRFDVATVPFPISLHPFSTHSFGVAEAVELGRTLKKIPSKVVFCGIEGKKFSRGFGLSEEIKMKLPNLIDIVNRIVEETVQSDHSLVEH